MGSIRPSNIKRIAEDLVEKNPGYFTEDFYKNREMLKGVITGVSKRTENLIAGYVTRYVLKKKARQKKEEEEGLAS
ncbi:30S ribosomal protein S17e [Thermogymnomonas acidicola]|uniref:Small ribosomal subunit protein eS17 n=1 Tax=Thermogymnomonas acidicola TaxID=399579 RepID=A0AA37BSF3_9ARCH|nr:30S ribosomal protein S17e [Thermogymnomonas acidicola]GGM78251.1 30S ribosomal protein S17e [Thermogymnomonas acidicola]